MLFGTWSQADAKDPSDYMETRPYYTMSVVWEMLILYRLPLNDLNIPKLNLSNISMIKQFLNNYIIIGLLLLRTHDCKHC